MSEKLSTVQKRVYSAMTPGVWYKSHHLPRATGHTYRALENKGLIVSRRYTPYESAQYTPLIYDHEFMRLVNAEATHE